MRAADQQRGQVARHAVTRRDQTEHSALPGGTFANGEDRRIIGAEAVVDHHPAAFGNGQACGPRQRILRADTGREHDQVGFQRFAVGEVHAVGIILSGDNFAGRPRQMHANTERFDPRLQRRATILIQLHRHQSRRKLDHVCFQPQ